MSQPTLELPPGWLRSRATTTALLRALPPLYGVVALGWNPAEWVAFWFVETVIVGAVNVPRILLSRGHPDPSERPPDATGFFAAPFFVLHYGFFVAIQQFFLREDLGTFDVS